MTFCNENWIEYGGHLEFETFSILVAVKWGWGPWEMEPGIFGKVSKSLRENNST